MRLCSNITLKIEMCHTQKKSFYQKITSNYICKCIYQYMSIHLHRKDIFTSQALSTNEINKIIFITGNMF